jgi:imidazolonepropionase-like amidohydrolase
MQRHQIREFEIRGRVCTPYEVLTQATSVNAEMLNRPGELGVVAEGAYADLIALDGDPLADLSVLAGQGERIPFMMKSGQFFKELL